MMIMDGIPQELVKSLMELGLLESEAKIYITLVMMNNSEVKKLIEFLGISKPNTYESLRLLKEKGLVVLINTRPMTYQATPPDIGLDMLLQNHLNSKEKAKNKAKKIFSTLDHENFIEKSPETLWHVFGGKSIKYKINDMIQSATKSIFLASSPKYLKYLEKFDEKNLKLDIVIFSDDMNTKEKLEKIFKDKKGNFQIVPYEAMINASVAAVPEEELITYKEALSMFEYENMMMLITDDSEVLFIPPVSQNSISAVNTKNKAFVMIMKIEFGSIPQINLQNKI
jgi:sugar-specific transcriptional regulator TrmB